MGEYDKERFRETSAIDYQRDRKTKNLGFEYPAIDNTLLTSEVDQNPKKPMLPANGSKKNMDGNKIETENNNHTHSSLSGGFEDESKVEGYDPGAVKLVTDIPDSLAYRIFIKTYRMDLHIAIRFLFVLIIAIAILIMGFFLLSKANEIIQFEIDYQKVCDQSFIEICEIPLQINTNIDFKRIYIYLSISSMPQAVKEFTETFSIDQLRQASPTQQKLYRDCGVKKKINQLDFDQSRFDIETLQFENPCGYLPQMFPIDEFLLFENNDDRNSIIEIETHEITSKYTREYTRRSSEQDFDVTLPQFANWMVV